jgi:hypothetical protein
MIKRPAGEGRFALHASKGRIAPLAGDDEPVSAGNTIRFGRRPEKGFFLFATAGNGIVAIFGNVLRAEVAGPR